MLRSRERLIFNKLNFNLTSCHSFRFLTTVTNSNTIIAFYLLEIQQETRASVDFMNETLNCRLPSSYLSKIYVSPLTGAKPVFNSDKHFIHHIQGPPPSPWYQGLEIFIKIIYSDWGRNMKLFQRSISIGTSGSQVCLLSPYLPRVSVISSYLGKHPD